ncbi:MAG TPA: hypothetical protein ENK04_07490 [Gammaproteobacteria bacterium]|nr:hypothetical protein [Gammaproteobacteria bacterium]
MIEVYPCRIIITDNKQLADAYNNDPENSLSASRCITVEEAFSLFEADKEIETVILINGEGEGFIHYLGEKFTWNKQNMPDIVRLEVTDDHKSAIKTIQESLAKSSLLFLWAGVSAG